MEKLLRLREHLEELQRLETAVQEHVLHDAVEKRNALTQAGQQVRSELAPGGGQSIKGQNIHETYRYLLRLNQSILASHQEVFSETEELQRRRLILLERSRDKKTLDKLQERKWSQWRYEAEREETHQLDEVGARERRRSGEQGKILLTAILLILCLGVGSLCFLVWSSWLKEGQVKMSWLRGPFDRMAEEQIVKELETYNEQERERREKRDAKLLSAPATEEGRLAQETDGHKRTITRILQKEEDLQRKESELDARESSLDIAQEDLKRELNRLGNLQKRISEDLAEIKNLESRRKAEMSADRLAKINELMNSLKGMSPKGAANLLFAVAFPSPTGPPSPLPLGQDLEGMELVVELLNKVPAKQKSEIFDAMTKQSPEKTAVIFDRLDNIKTGMEEDRFFREQASAASVPKQTP
jgi:flagellar FliJ protein